MTDSDVPEVLDGEADARVRGLLGQLNVADPVGPIPEHVSDAVLAAVRREAESRNAHHSSEQAPEQPPQLAPELVTHPSWWRRHKLVLSGAAAVAGLTLLAAPAILSQPETPVLASMSEPLSTGTNYSRTRLADQVAEHLRNLRSQASAGKYRVAPISTGGFVANEASREECVEELVKDQPLLITVNPKTSKVELMDVAEYENAPAVVIAVSAAEGAGRYQVWVVGLGCHDQNAQVRQTVLVTTF